MQVLQDRVLELAAGVESHTGEIKRLQRCINDLVSIVALPAMWSGGESGQVVRTLLDMIHSILQLDLAYIQLNDSSLLENGAVHLHSDLSADPNQVRSLLDGWLAAQSDLAPHGKLVFEGTEVSIAAIRLGLQTEVGWLVAGSRRSEFPQQTESLILSVAVNQAAIGLQEVRRRNQQTHLARELDRKVVERTQELAEANHILTGEIAERKNVEDRLRQSEAALRSAIEEIRHSEGKLRQVLDTIPVIAWCNLPDGPNEYLNKRWRDYTGLTPEESHGWAWCDAMHPDDLPKLMTKWTEIMMTGHADQIEGRFRGANGAYRWFLIQAQPFRGESGQIVRWYGTSTDIEEFKKTQRALQLSETKLGLIVDTIPAMVWSTRPDGFADFFNANYFAYLGLSREEVLGWGWTQAVHPDDVAGLAQAWDALRAAGKAGEAEARLRRFDGEYRWFLMRAEPMRDADGNILKWFGLNTDIDDRKRAEEALRASETNLRAQINSIPGLVCTMNAMGEVEQFNRPLLEFFGKSPAELRQWGTTDAVHPDDLPRVIEAFSRAVATGIPYDVEHRCRRFDGVYIWFQVRALAVRDSNGAVTGWYVLLTDIDDRKRVEEQLRRSEEFLNEGQNLARLANFTWRVETEDLRWSEQLCRIFEFDPDEVVTLKKIGTRVHPEDLNTLREFVEKARQGVPELHYEYRLVMPNRSVKYVQLIAHAGRDEHGRAEYVGALQDVTERHLAEAALARARTELANVSRITSLSALTASIAHEVNQPISGIVTNASTCLRMLASDPPNVEGARETARRAIRDGNRAAEVIARLRTLFTRKGSTVEVLNLNEAIREVIALTLSELQKNQVVLRLQLDDDLPMLRGDRVQLQQVILNLVRNAADAMLDIYDRRRELTIQTRRESPDRIRLTVVDAGVGLDPEAADQLFQPFFTTKPEGMGIGLSISRSIIEAHQGSLWAFPNDGPGATFCFTIPCEGDTKVQ